MATEWGGPVSVAVFVPFPRGTLAATACRTAIRDWMRALTRAPAAALLSVSLLYAIAAAPTASCEVAALGSHLAGAPAPPASKAARAAFVARGYTAGALTRRRLTAQPSFRDLYDAMYPVNRLRNLAWEEVPERGAFVFLLDVDFVPSPGLHADLVAGAWAGKLRSMRLAYERWGRREALVVPAFERTRAHYTGHCAAEADCDWIAGVETPRSVERLRPMVADGSAQVFHFDKVFRDWGCRSTPPQSLAP